MNILVSGTSSGLGKYLFRKLPSKKFDRDNPRYLSNEKFDLIICTDTLNYLGDLSDFVQNITKVMKKDTPLIFSTERMDSEERSFTIGNSERFAHTDTYIEHIFGSGFATYKRSCMVREEEGKPVDGTLWIVVPLESRFKK